jgi:hypothetical protein
MKVNNRLASVIGNIKEMKEANVYNLSINSLWWEWLARFKGVMMVQRNYRDVYKS